MSVPQGADSKIKWSSLLYANQGDLILLVSVFWKHWQPSPQPQWSLKLTLGPAATAQSLGAYYSPLPKNTLATISSDPADLGFKNM